MHCPAPQALMKAGLADIRKLAAPEPRLQARARETRCAAFAFVAALVVATQKSPKIFAAPFNEGEAATLCTPHIRNCTSSMLGYQAAIFQGRAGTSMHCSSYESGRSAN